MKRSILAGLLFAGLTASSVRAQELTDFAVMPPAGFNFPNSKPMDILGIYPGMPMKQAVPIVVKHAADTHKATGIYGKAGERETRDPFTGERYSFFIGSGADGDVRTRPKDGLAVIASSTTAANQVLAIGRQMRFDIGEQPPAEATFDSLVKKYGMPPLRQSRQEAIPSAPKTCSLFRWQYADGSPDLAQVFEPDLGGWITLLDHYQTKERLTQALADFYARNTATPMNGIQLTATLCTGEVAGRLETLNLIMTDLSRVAGAREIERERIDAAKAEVEFQKQQAPAGQVPRL